MPSELFEACDKLLRDTGGRKVMLCGTDGEVIAHAGPTLRSAGAFDDATSDAVAALVADVLSSAGKTSAEELVVALPTGLSACGTAVDNRAVLIVIFDGVTTLDRVRTKMRRARDQMTKSLPSEKSAGKSEPS